MDDRSWGQRPPDTTYCTNDHTEVVREIEQKGPITPEQMKAAQTLANAALDYYRLGGQATAKMPNLPQHERSPEEVTADLKQLTAGTKEVRNMEGQFQADLNIMANTLRRVSSDRQQWSQVLAEAKREISSKDPSLKFFQLQPPYYDGDVVLANKDTQGQGYNLVHGVIVIGCSPLHYGIYSGKASGNQPK